MGLGMILDTVSGGSPLYRLEEVFTHQDTTLLLGKAIAPEAFRTNQLITVACCGIAR